MLRKRVANDYLLDHDFRKKNPIFDKFDPHLGNVGEYLEYTIVDNSGKYIGHAMIYQIDRKKLEAEVGLSIYDTSAHNKGYGTQTLTELIAICRLMHAKRIHSKVISGNYNAMRMNEKCGMKNCGTANMQGYTFILYELYLS